MSAGAATLRLLGLCALAVTCTLGSQAVFAAISVKPSSTPHPALTSRARPAPGNHKASAAPSLDSQAVLTRYSKTLAAYHTPSTLSFVYRIDQVGSRGLSQTHLMYRSGMMVRDETIAMGSSNVKPHIHIYRTRAHHYLLETVAPRLSLYRFHFVGMRQEAGRVYFRYQTTPIYGASGFEVSAVEIDGTDPHRTLPTTIEFRSHGVSMNGSGVLHYGPVEDAWVLLEAEADGTGNRGTLREHMVFSDYHFPAMLPSSTFGVATQ